jgi:hypothetical protein
MIWLTWRQFRAQAVVTAAALAVLAIALAATGPHIASLFASSGLTSCHRQAHCGMLAIGYVSEIQNDAVDHSLFNATIVVLYVVPGLIGVFWGAPLVTREIETHTYRLAWTQSVTRGRWLAVKLGLLGLGAVGAAGLATQAVGWWSAPIGRALQVDPRADTNGLSRLDPLLFGTRGIVPLGYAAVAFALGVTAGILIRRTLPAMAVTLGGFAFLQAVWPTWIRPHLITPLRSAGPLNVAAINQLSIGNNGVMTVTAAVSKPGAWVLSNQAVTASGRPFTGPATSACMGP